MSKAYNPAWLFIKHAVRFFAIFDCLFPKG